MSQKTSNFTSIDTTIYNLDKRLETLRECLKIEEKINGLTALIFEAQELQRGRPSSKISNIIASSRNELLKARISSREKTCPLSPVSTKIEIKQLTEKRNNLLRMDKYFKKELSAPLGVPISPRRNRGGKASVKTYSSKKLKGPKKESA